MIRYLLLILAIIPCLAYGQEKDGCVYGNCENGKGKYVYSNGFT